jgi:16S rRNA processing protein RimM
MQMIAKCIVKGKEVLFPLNEDIVIEINEEEKKVFVELPSGLLDVYMA